MVFDTARIFRQMVTLLSAAVLVFAVLGCSNSVGIFKGQGTDAGVSLGKKNYQIIKVSVRGESRGFNLFGFIPIKSPSYANAKDDLYEEAGVSFSGRAIALVNQTEDKSSLYLILFSIPKVTISADIIEYTD